MDGTACETGGAVVAPRHWCCGRKAGAASLAAWLPGGGRFPVRSGDRTDQARSGRKWQCRGAHPTHRGAWYYRAMSAS